jgi:hypothetical protein
MSNSSNGRVKRTCTCANLPFILSTNTAAEFGDLGSLSQRIARGTVTAKTSEPLHLAAQHGHTAMTFYLLQNGYHADSGSKDLECKSNSSTPLHRACYSGAIGCVKLLLDHDANLLLHDHSFFDGMTPLHKAVKGGRHYVVALIINHISENSEELLKKVLHAKDSSDRTPMELGLELESKGEEEILSLRRWDGVAGGPADFSKCVHLLKCAIESLGLEKIHRENDQRGELTILMSTIPDFFCADDMCRTKAWEKSFTAVLIKSTENKISLDMEEENHERNKQQNVSSFFPTCDNYVAHANGSSCEIAKTPSHSKGRPCSNCKRNTFALFRVGNDTLVCRKCKKLPDFRR